MIRGYRGGRGSDTLLVSYSNCVLTAPPGDRRSYGGRDHNQPGRDLLEIGDRRSYGGRDLLELGDRRSYAGRDLLEPGDRRSYAGRLEVLDPHFHARHQLTHPYYRGSLALDSSQVRTLSLVTSIPSLRLSPSMQSTPYFSHLQERRLRKGSELWTSWTLSWPGR